MLAPFLGCIPFKDQVFAITYTGEIWRLWMDYDMPFMQKLIGDETEWNGPIKLLRAYKDLYQ